MSAGKETLIPTSIICEMTEERLFITAEEAEVMGLTAFKLKLLETFGGLQILILLLKV